MMVAELFLNVSLFSVRVSNFCGFTGYSHLWDSIRTNLLQKRKRTVVSILIICIIPCSPWIWDLILNFVAFNKRWIVDRMLYEEAEPYLISGYFSSLSSRRKHMLKKSHKSATHDGCISIQRSASAQIYFLPHRPQSEKKMCFFSKGLNFGK